MGGSCAPWLPQPAVSAPMSKIESCVLRGTEWALDSGMLLEKLPDVQSLPPEEKWRLIDELWRDLASHLESAPPAANVVELLEKRFADYLAEPSQARPMDEGFARLAERKQQWN
jgi:putative addiction module component (TIGR02574 family)